MTASARTGVGHAGGLASGLPLWTLAVVLFTFATGEGVLEGFPHGYHELVVYGVLTLVLFGMGYRIGRRTTVGEGLRIAVFTALAAGFAGAAMGALVLEETTRGVRLVDPLSFVVTGAFIGAIIGAPVGLAYVELTNTKREHERAAERTARLATRLSVKDRVLRHNLRNGTNVILGNARTLDRIADGTPFRDHVRPIIDAGEELVALSDDAARIQRLFGSGSVTEAIAVRDLLEAQSGLGVAVDLPSPTVAVRVHPAIEEAFAELLRSIRAVADDPDPAILLSTSHLSGVVDVTITLGGWGLPESAEIPLLGEKEETLTHWDDLTLWHAYWTIALSDGETAIEETPDGTVVHLLLPSATL